MSQSIIICPNAYKDKCLKNKSLSMEFDNTKYMNKTDFFNRAFFSYDEKTIYYLMKEYNYTIDVCKVYLNNLYFIEDKDYKSDRLSFLRNLKNELIAKNLLYFDSVFSNYIKEVDIELKNIYDLDLYEEEKINHKFIVNDTVLNFPVLEFKTMEKEINYVCLKIIELINKGVSLSNIYLCNVDSDYFFLLEKMFSYYHIPIMIPYKHSIYSTKIVQDYLKSGVITEDDNEIVKLLYNALNKVSSLNDDDIKRSILIDILKHTYITNLKIESAVVIGDLYDYSFDDSDYVFVLGFNQDSLPKTYKDINYISDSLKEEVRLYTTKELNIREKKYLSYILSNITNLTVTYKLSSSFKKYYPSNMISDYSLEVKRINEDNYNYSDLYNRICLEEKLDSYYLYGEKDNCLDTLINHYKDIQYKTYNHLFKGINKDKYLTNISYPLRVSYSSLNTYYECPFKYYCQYVLRIGKYEDTFASYIGSLYHHILSLYKRNGFSLDKEWNLYLENRDLSLKETLLLVRIRKDLEELIKKLEEQSTYTKFTDEYYEKELKVTLREDILVEFVGYIDKIMFYQNIADTYFAIVDYKTGSIDTHLEPIKYGLHMQLAIYLFLIEYSNLFKSPIFSGIYYQNILFSFPTWSKKVDTEKSSLYLLNGYSTDDTCTLEKFDLTYKESSLIKSMSYTEEKGFSRYSKIFSDNDIDNLIKFTKKKIDVGVDDILDAKFSIEPKVYEKNNISCAYCKFKDICFYDESDLIYLESVSDLSFLGGE